MSLNYLPFSLLDFVQYSFLQIFLLLLFLMTNRFHDRHSYLPFILLFVWWNFVWKNKREVVEMIDQPQGHCLPNFEKYQKTWKYQNMCFIQEKRKKSKFNRFQIEMFFLWNIRHPRPHSSLYISSNPTSNISSSNLPLVLIYAQGILTGFCGTRIFSCSRTLQVPFWNIRICYKLGARKFDFPKISEIFLEWVFFFLKLRKFPRENF